MAAMGRPDSASPAAGSAARVDGRFADVGKAAGIAAGATPRRALACAAAITWARNAPLLLGGGLAAGNLRAPFLDDIGGVLDHLAAKIEPCGFPSSAAFAAAPAQHVADLRQARELLQKGFGLRWWGGGIGQPLDRGLQQLADEGILFRRGGWIEQALEQGLLELFADSGFRRRLLLRGHQLDRLAGPLGHQPDRGIPRHGINRRGIRALVEFFDHAA